jgi:hypothetical protein
MVAELYDEGELHHALGIPFEPVSDKTDQDQPQPDPKSSPSLLARLGGGQPSPQKDARRSSKRQRDRSPSPKEFVVLDSDDSAWNAADQGARCAAENSDSDSEGGRYGVEPARKRSRKELAADVVWISDDSDHDRAPTKGLSIAGASKRAEKSGLKDTSGKRERVDKRREYWQSKGPSGGNEDDD